ncbi:MAG: TauD/TfdA family dioxygenase [Pseudomonadota bacterium]
MHIAKLTGTVGAELTEIDLKALDETEFAKVKDALWTHGVLAFRDQKLSPADHVAFAERWGEINVNRFLNKVEGYPQIADVRTLPSQNIVIGGTWHTDHSYDPAPAMASILVARELPDFGGDTCFASQTAAYAHLSSGLKATLEGLNAWHSDSSFEGADHRFGIGADTGVESLHPVIITHPQSGQRALYVNVDFTMHFDGWTREESQPLLDYLYAFCTQPAFQCRISYAPGTVVMWDNRLVQHFAVADYQGQGRYMQRITIEGQPLK